MNLVFTSLEINLKNPIQNKNLFGRISLNSCIEEIDNYFNYLNLIIKQVYINLITRHRLIVDYLQLVSL